MEVCRQQRGRKREPLPPAVLERWSAANNRPPPAFGRNSREQAIFDLTCGQCKTTIQIKTVCKKGDGAFQCRLHSKGGRGISAPQREAVEILRQIPGVGRISLEQYRVLPLMQKPIDIVLEDHGLLIEVDGSQHLQAGSAFGEAAGEQYRRDREVDRGVLSSGARMVRLDCRDAASWASHVQAAMRRVQQQPSSSFVYYSASYPASSRVTAATP